MLALIETLVHITSVQRARAFGHQVASLRQTPETKLQKYLAGKINKLFQMVRQNITNNFMAEEPWSSG